MLLRSEIVFRDRRLTIKQYNTDERGTVDRQHAKEEDFVKNKNRIIIKDLPSDFDDFKVKKFFMRFGVVDKFYLEKAGEDRRGGTNDNLHTGHVVFRKQESVSKALEFGNFIYLRNGEKANYESYREYEDSKKAEIYELKLVSRTSMY